MMKSLHGQLKRTDSEGSRDFQSDEWMLEEFGKRSKECRELPDGTFVTKKPDEGVDFIELDEQNTIPSQLRASVISNSESVMTDFMMELIEFYSKIVYYGDDDSL